MEEHYFEMSSFDDRAAALEREQRLQMFLDSVQDYAFISFDLDGRVVGWSRGAERILGHSETDALGMPSEMFFTPEDVARGEDRREFMLAREAGRAEDERWHLRRDGSRFWASGVMTPRMDPEGRLHGYSKVLRDQSKLAEARLRDSEERLRLFCENVSDYALVPVDLEGRVAGWNAGAAHIFGYAAKVLHDNTERKTAEELREQLREKERLRSRPGEGTIIDVRVPLFLNDNHGGPGPAAPTTTTQDQG